MRLINIHGISHSQASAGEVAKPRGPDYWTKPNSKNSSSKRRERSLCNDLIDRGSIRDELSSPIWYRPHSSWRNPFLLVLLAPTSL